MGIESRRPRGHRLVPHTADMRLEAWAPSREECIAEAVSAMVESFAEVPADAPRASIGFEVQPQPDEDMLVSVLDEVVYLVDATGQVPAEVEVKSSGDAIEVWLRVVDAAQARPVGAVPKAVSLHELHFGPTNSGWSCGVTVDV